MARIAAWLIFEVELATSSAISPRALLRALRPLCRYSTMSPTLQDFRPLRSAPSSRGANQPSTSPPPKARPPLSPPNRFLGVWQAPQCAAPVTRYPPRFHSVLFCWFGSNISGRKNREFQGRMTMREFSGQRRCGGGGGVGNGRRVAG